ncbi:hypothetical protein Phum_PHUM090340 [Pediculus humanus corporis]|uniref:Apple domain-containing protein n=1 Tax=Pediculus humanus subsp. corporis TaxID=121224 RepID=E0VCL8_PEDHC|nr:uncharacterized protein Phum_PHUM090340 [Pediculus humanus corporis]EEB11124.1 hypothetical protein Phum_PHUM090340 [Pediculus humanus corporis]
MIIIITTTTTLLRVTSSSDVNHTMEISSQQNCRISTNERLIAHTVTRIVEQNNIKGCEEQCKIYKCTFFGYGILANASRICELTTDRQISRRFDPNFSVYEKTHECIHGKPIGYEEGKKKNPKRNRENVSGINNVYLTERITEVEPPTLNDDDYYDYEDSD